MSKSNSDDLELMKEGKAQGYQVLSPYSAPITVPRTLPESFQWLLSISCCYYHLYCTDCRTKVFSQRSHRAGRFLWLENFPKWLSNAVFKEEVLECPAYSLELGRRVGSVEEREPQQQMIQGQRWVQQPGQVEKPGREGRGHTRATFFLLNHCLIRREGLEASLGWRDAK